MQKQVLLLVDDNKESLRSVELCFARADYEVLTAPGGRAALELLGERPVDVVVCDLMMPDVDGMEVLRAARQLNPAPEFLLLTAFGSIESAVEALKLGACDYLTKPVNLNELRQHVGRAMEHRRLVVENLYLRSQIDQRFGFEEIIGEHKSMRELFKQIRMVAASRATVLIEGGSGTGKELVARAIHFNSPRAKAPFVPLHCASLAESLLESELFGHEKGAFTGADAQRAGRFERADGGSLFLDEISEIPPAMQVSLLRVLETREFERVGGAASIAVDVRLIAATNRDIEALTRAGDFRQDLFFRLRVVHLRLPPLRERASDIPLLVDHFLKMFAAEHDKPLPAVSHKAMMRLMAYEWPGNVRELRNLVENLIIFLDHDTITEDDLSFARVVDEAGQDSVALPLGLELEAVECEYIRRSLLRCGGNVTHTAQALGIARRTLQKKMKEWGLES
ncbi:sigma-54-dependent transcriptional regulator [Candidatus Sumerlaeota bacterium]